MADLLHDPTDITTVNSAINPNPDGLSPSDDGSETNSGPFEGPEKLLEIWFAPSPYDVPDAAQPDENGRFGLRKVKREVWEEMLDLVKCKVLSVVEGKEIDAYLLRWVFMTFGYVAFRMFSARPIICGDLMELRPKALISSFLSISVS